MIPIPGTKRRPYLDETVAALNVTLTAGVVKRIEAMVPVGCTFGSQYPEAMMETLHR